MSTARVSQKQLMRNGDADATGTPITGILIYAKYDQFVIDLYAKSIKTKRMSSEKKFISSKEGLTMILQREYLFIPVECTEGIWKLAYITGTVFGILLVLQ